MNLRLRQLLCRLLVLGVLGMPMARAQTAAGLARQAQDFYKNEKLEEAIAAYRQALALDPDSPVLQYNLGTVLARKGEVNDAATVLHQSAALPTSPARPDALFNLGTALAESALQPSGGLAGKTAGGQVAGGPPTKQQMETLEKSLQAFREAILNDPRPKTRQEAQYNYEVTHQMLEELKRRQPEQQQQQQGGSPPPNQPTPTPTPTPTPLPPGATPTPTPSPPGGEQQNEPPQNQQQGGQGQPQPQNQQQQDPQQNPQAGQETAATPTPQPTPGNQGTGEPKQHNPQDSGQQHGLEGSGTPTPTPRPGQAAGAKPEQAKPGTDAPGADAGARGTQPPGLRETPTPEQLNALRLLNMLEEENPEQYKKLYQFRGRPEQAPQKDW